MPVEDGIVALGGDLEPETLLMAYRQGIFPWPISGLPLAWFCPPERAILEWKDLHLSRSLRKWIDRSRQEGTYRFTIDQAFPEVIRQCASVPRPDQDGTWITSKMTRAYIRLHQLGHAHSMEIWRNQTLVGGLYGVDGGGFFAGESMFHKEPNVSKWIVLSLMEHLHSQGLEWMDIQVMTPHMKALGAQVISRDAFLSKLEQAKSQGISLFPRI
jgi:leucyl/phenylalanyl-tRNA--protein transferase